MVQPSENPAATNRAETYPAPAALLAAARSCVRRGWHVFPLLPGTKVPSVCGWESKATLDPDMLITWWSRIPFNIGIATGPSGLLVVDLDVPKEGEDPDCSGERELRHLAHEAGHEVPDTFTVLTGRGGFHRYHLVPQRQELRNSAGRLAPHIDTRAAGGYVLAPGSAVNGNPYVVLDRRPPVPLPAWLSERLRPAPLPVNQPTAIRLRPGVVSRRQAAYLRSAIAREVRRVEEAPCGQRNRALFVAAIALGQLVAGGAVSDAYVREVLDQAAAVHVGRDGFTAAEAHRTITSGLRVGARRPRSLPGAAA
ncbi:bifunctional DNA primase/polymerase-like protein [Kineococcus xinjiangensis]|uniref:Bifunctional DNA primase/polymerase-like protein n=1 Tax=Kineococcus xinjiangensis TaxID=512762 RepID=A0A2S6IJ24_9ACTN|nr:bifunctional DNA primase/polymerase [Kineococcus xinjiangensis]PPK94223.1 bifunctional DNA primase/polymerase-like protein [Kineococcus xinjiangensis]